MKLWHCQYRWYGGFGAYQFYDCISIADTSDKAIELAMGLCKFGEPKENWTAEEIPMENNTSIFISSETD